MSPFAGHSKACSKVHRAAGASGSSAAWGVVGEVAAAATVAAGVVGEVGAYCA